MGGVTSSTTFFIGTILVMVVYSGLYRFELITLYAFSRLKRFLDTDQILVRIVSHPLDGFVVATPHVFLTHFCRARVILN